MATFSSLMRPDQGIKPGFEMVLPAEQMASLNDEELGQLAAINERISGLSEEDKEKIDESMEDLQQRERERDPKYYLDALKHLASGFTRQWKSLNPETGEAEWVAPRPQLSPQVAFKLGMSMEEMEEENEERKQWNEERFNPGIIAETKEFAEIPYAVADFFTDEDIERPEWLTGAMETAQEMAEANREAWEVDAPRGWLQHGAEGLGMMAGQIPIPGKALEKAIDVVGAPVRAVAGPLSRMMGKVPAPVRTAGRIGAMPFKALSEAAVPIVTPKLQNYLMGAGANALLGSMVEPSEEEFRLEEMREDRQEEVERNAPEMLAFIEENWNDVSMEEKMGAIYDPDYGSIVWEALDGEQQMEMLRELEDRGVKYAEQE